MFLIQFLPQIFHMASDHVGPKGIFIPPQPFFQRFFRDNFSSVIEEILQNLVFFFSQIDGTVPPSDCFLTVLTSKSPHRNTPPSR